MRAYVSHEVWRHQGKSRARKSQSPLREHLSTVHFGSVALYRNPTLCCCCLPCSCNVVRQVKSPKSGEASEEPKEWRENLAKRPQKRASTEHYRYGEDSEREPGETAHIHRRAMSKETGSFLANTDKLMLCAVDKNLEKKLDIRLIESRPVTEWSLHLFFRTDDVCTSKVRLSTMD